MCKPYVCLHCPALRPVPKQIKKMGCLGLCGGVHTAQKAITTQILIGFTSVVLGIWQCERSISPNSVLSVQARPNGCYRMMQVIGRVSNA